MQETIDIILYIVYTTYSKNSSYYSILIIIYSNLKLKELRSINKFRQLCVCPHKSHYDGFSFWHTKKLIRHGPHSYALMMGYTPDFKFHLLKYGQGRYNSRDVIDEKYVDCQEIEGMFIDHC